MYHLWTTKYIQLLLLEKREEVHVQDFIKGRLDQVGLLIVFTLVIITVWTSLEY